MRTSLLLAMISLFGCGGSVELPSGGAGSTSGAGGASSTTTASSGSSSSSGGGAFCGGEAGVPCAGDEYCDFADDQCGGNDGGGVCKPRPMGCDDIYQPTCGCDGKVHGNACDANMAGVDSNALGGCPPPPGMFGCGAGFCMVGMSYCEHDVVSSPVFSSTYACKPLPAACNGMPSCACLLGVMCGVNCMATPNSGAQVTCSQ